MGHLPPPLLAFNREELRENELWHKIRCAARTNLTLHDALERAKIVYYLSESNGQKSNQKT